MAKARSPVWMAIPMLAHGQQGQIDGTGEVNYPDGSVYTGSFCADLADGQGKIVYPDGSSYEGEWQQARHQRNRHRKICEWLGL